MKFNRPNCASTNTNYTNREINNMNNSNNHGMENNYDVIIVGAGLSGLYAANVLLESGVDNFCVLEARDRVGGRTFTRIDPKVGYVDLGASYVGPTQIYVHRLIEKLGLQTYKVNTRGRNVYLNKRKRYLHACDTLPAMGPLVEREVKSALSLFDQMCAEIPIEKPWTAPKAAEWDRVTFGQFLERNCWTREAREFLSIYIGCSTSCEAYECSLLWTLWFTKQCDGLDTMFNIEEAAQDSKIVGGSQQISVKLRERIGAERRVMLNKAVIQITRLGDDDKDNDNSEEANKQDGRQWPSIEVRTLDGCRYRTRYIIMAIPIALQLKIHYDPALPSMFNQMIQKMPMGSAIKCVVYYRDAFWRRDSLTGSMLINRDPEDGPISYTLDDTKPDGTYPAIVGFIIGDRAKAMLAKSKQERLRIICGSYAKALDSCEALQPIHYEEKNWMSEQYTGGCFTAFGIPGFITTYGELLRRPLWDGRIHLAGTETATYWSGYMDGALQAGERAAIQVMQRLNVQIDRDTIIESTCAVKLQQQQQLQQQSNGTESVKSSHQSIHNHEVKRPRGNNITQLALALSISQLLTLSGIGIALLAGLIITATY